MREEVYEVLEMYGDALAALSDDVSADEKLELIITIAKEHCKMMFILRALEATGRVTMENIAAAAELYNDMNYSDDG